MCTENLVVFSYLHEKLSSLCCMCSYAVSLFLLHANKIIPCVDLGEPRDLQWRLAPGMGNYKSNGLLHLCLGGGVGPTIDRCIMFS